MGSYGNMHQKHYEEQRENGESRYVSATFLASQGIHFCILDAEQDHADSRGNPQIGYQVGYVWGGFYYIKQLDLLATDWRMEDLRNMIGWEHEDGHVGFPFHHMALNRLQPKKGTNPYYKFADHPNEAAPCSCTGAGVMDLDNPETWTEHYKLTRQLNDILVAKHLDPMETGDMTVEQLVNMLRLSGTAA